MGDVFLDRINGISGLTGLVREGGDGGAWRMDGQEGDLGLLLRVTLEGTGGGRGQGEPIF